MTNKHQAVWRPLAAWIALNCLAPFIEPRQSSTTMTWKSQISRVDSNCILEKRGLAESNTTSKKHDKLLNFPLNTVHNPHCHCFDFWDCIGLHGCDKHCSKALVSSNFQFQSKVNFDIWTFHYKGNLSGVLSRIGMSTRAVFLSGKIQFPPKNPRNFLLQFTYTFSNHLNNPQSGSGPYVVLTEFSWQELPFCLKNFHVILSCFSCNFSC